MKNKNVFKKIACMFFVVVCCLSCFNFSAFADDGDYGEAPPQNIIEIPTGTGPSNVLMNVPQNNQNADTLIFLMDYAQYLYSFNMTNGQKPFLIVCSPTAVEMYCTPIRAESVYVINKVVSGNYINFNISVNNTAGYQSYQNWLLHSFGNFNISNTVNSTSTVQFYWGNTSSASNISYIYLNQDGTYTYYAASSSTSGVYYPLVEMYLNMKNFIEQTGVSLPGVSANTTLDIGSIISAVMSAPMIIFGGLTGSPGDLSQSLELFGIDIRATLISLLVIAIVIFIIKFLRGG